MTDQTPEIERRKMNLVEACILAAILGMATMLFSLRDSMVQVQEQLKAQNVLFTAMQAQLADVPTLSQRVSKVEIRQEANIDAIKELRSMKGIK
jgi:hypothetical protein